MIDNPKKWSAPVELYLVMKSLHVVGAILFVGNIIVSGWWKAMADRTRDPRIIAFAQGQVTLTDWAFTLSGIVLLALSGAAGAAIGGLPAATPWIATGSALFGASGVIWIAILVPLQMRLGRMAKMFATSGAIPADYWRLEKRWAVFGLIATLLPLAAVPVMVFKAG
jgi:uncharacterized membrane protein